jgi:hypothetical protein
MKILFSLSLVISLFLSGCFQPKPTVAKKPSWITNSQGGAVGMCAPHMNGIAAQEEAAQNRARRQLALDKSTQVHASVTDAQKESGGRYSSSSAVSSTLKANVTISSHIKDSWRDPQTNKYYVWMVAD